MILKSKRTLALTRQSTQSVCPYCHWSLSASCRNVSTPILSANNSYSSDRSVFWFSHYWKLGNSGILGIQKRRNSSELQVITSPEWNFACCYLWYLWKSISLSRVRCPNPWMYSERKGILQIRHESYWTDLVVTCARNEPLVSRCLHFELLYIE